MSFFNCSPDWKARRAFFTVFLTALFLVPAVGANAQTCGIQWRWANPLPSGTYWRAIAVGDGGYVAIDAANTVYTSQDGFTWQRRPAFSTEALHGFVWGNGRYLASVGDTLHPVLWSSRDGITWTPTLGLDVPLGWLLFEGGRFYAPSSQGLLTSHDGMAWTAIDLGKPLVSLYGIAYGNGTTVVLANGGDIFTSSDGQTWTFRPKVDSRGPLSVRFGNGTFVAAGLQGEILTSTDGYTWSEVSPFTQKGPNVFRFGAGHFILQTEDKVWFTSEDGLAWTERDFPFTWITALAGRETETVALCYFPGPGSIQLPGIAVTQDDLTWTRLDTTATESDLTSAAYGGYPPRTVAVGYGGTVIVAADGGPFQPVSAPTSTDLKGVAWGNERFVAVGAGGTILTSEDGLTWQLRPSGVTSDLLCVRRLNGLFLATGAGGTILTSEDGLQWTYRNSGTQEDLLSAAYGAGQLAVVGKHDTILSSSDGASWTIRYQGPSSFDYLMGVAYGNGVFCAVGGWGSQGLTSRDGSLWVKNDKAQNAIGITFWQGQFVAPTGSGSQCSVSEDGENWVEFDSSEGAQLRSISALGDRLIGVGSYGRVLEASCGPAVTGLSPNHGSTVGGDSVTLTGAHMDETTGVFFGGLPALSYSIVSPDELTAVAPPFDPREVYVTVRTSDNESPLSPGCRFQYNLPPFLYSVTPQKFSVLGGDSVEVIGANFTSGTTLLIDGYEVPTSPYSDTLLHATTLPHPPGTVDVAIRAFDGQTATLAGALTFVDPPVVLSAKVVRQPAFKLKLTGANFHVGCTVEVNGEPAPKVKYKNSGLLVVKGSSVARLFKKGWYYVPVRVVNTDDGVSGPTFVVHPN